MCAGYQTKTLLHAAVKGFGLLIKTRRSLTLTTQIIDRISALMDFSRIEIQEQGEVRNMSLSCNHRELGHKFGSNIACKTLIGNARIKATIGDYQLASLK